MQLIYRRLLGVAVHSGLYNWDLAAQVVKEAEKRLALCAACKLKGNFAKEVCAYISVLGDIQRRKAIGKIRGFCLRVVCPYDKGSRAVCNDVIGDIHADLVIRKIVRAEVRPVISEKHEHIRIIKAV